MGILRKAAQLKPEPVPRGFRTSKQWAIAEGLSQPHAHRLIVQLCADGQWEMRRILILTSRGLYPVPHYGPKGRGK